MKLYIGNLPFQSTEDDLQNWFAQSGIVVDSVNLIRDRFSGEPRGFGFVEINNNEQADMAIRMCNGKEMMGRNLVINEARPAGTGGAGGNYKASGGGAGRGGGGGGGRGGNQRW
jgi:RNA recognition motif-containing protein